MIRRCREHASGLEIVRLFLIHSSNERTSIEPQRTEESFSMEMFTQSTFELVTTVGSLASVYMHNTL